MPPKLFPGVSKAFKVKCNNISNSAFATGETDKESKEKFEKFFNSFIESISSNLSLSDVAEANLTYLYEECFPMFIKIICKIYPPKEIIKLYSKILIFVSYALSKGHFYVLSYFKLFIDDENLQKKFDSIQFTSFSKYYNSEFLEKIQQNENLYEIEPYSCNYGMSPNSQDILQFIDIPKEGNITDEEKEAKIKQMKALFQSLCFQIFGKRDMFQTIFKLIEYAPIQELIPFLNILNDNSQYLTKEFKNYFTNKLIPIITKYHNNYNEKHLVLLRLIYEFSITEENKEKSKAFYDVEHKKNEITKLLEEK